MKIILLSGGSGKRLWPLSNGVRSKQFLKLLINEDHMYESMVQRIWRQLKSAGMVNSTYVATSKEQADILQSQLGDKIRMIVEPERRDTFPAIALACAYLFSVEKVSKDEVVCVLPADAFANNDFFDKILEMEGLIHSPDVDLALIGVKPSYPAENYGYIVPTSMKPSLATRRKYYSVNYFIEKPKTDLAKELLEKHALWNCGVFAFRLGFMIKKLIEKDLPTSFTELGEMYGQLPYTSFDYEVLEKSNRSVVIPFSGAWKDLGVWSSLTEGINSKVLGKGVISADSTDTHLINELNIPVAIQGISNAVVAASNDGILITNKASCSRIKELIQSFQNRPMFEEKRWGWYRVLDHVKYSEEKEVLVKRLKVMKGKNLSYQFHKKRSEVWTIVSGEGDFVLNDVIFRVKQGDVLQITIGSKHGIKALTDLEFIEVQTGNELIESDIERVFMSWEEVERHCKYYDGNSE